jgi:hypothetical protein
MLGARASPWPCISPANFGILRTRHCVWKVKTGAGPGDHDAPNFYNIWQHVSTTYTCCDLSETSDLWLYLGSLTSWHEHQTTNIWLVFRSHNFLYHYYGIARLMLGVDQSMRSSASSAQEERLHGRGLP